MPPEGVVLESAIQSAANDWRPHLTDELRADPVVAGWAEKAGEKDIASLIRTNAHAQKRLGTAINLPGKDAEPDEVSALKTKLIEAGVLPAPITDPKDYAIAKPENLPEGMQWSDELSSKFASTLHKYQIPKEAVNDLMALHLESVGGVAQSLKINREESLASLKAEHGEKYDERLEMVKRMTSALFQTPEELAFFEATGLGDHPKFLSVLLRLAPLAMQDSSFIESIPRQGGEITGEAAKEEYTKIMNDKTHPMYEGYHRTPMDPKVDAYITELYKKAYGNQKKPE